jgi:hypothetical protein
MQRFQQICAALGEKIDGIGHLLKIMEPAEKELSRCFQRSQTTSGHMGEKSPIRTRGNAISRGD